MNKEQIQKYVKEGNTKVPCDSCGSLVKVSVSWPHKDGLYCRDCILTVVNHDTKQETNK